MAHFGLPSAEADGTGAAGGVQLAIGAIAMVTGTVTATVEMPDSGLATDRDSDMRPEEIYINLREIRGG